MMKIIFLICVFLTFGSVSAQTEIFLENESIHGLRYSPDQKSLLVTTGIVCDPPEAQIFITQDYHTISQIFNLKSMIPEHGFICSHYGIWSPTGTKIATTGNDGTVRIWDVLTGEQISFDYTNFLKGVSSLSWRADETQVMGVSGGDWGLYMVDVATGKETFFPTLNPTTSARWHPDDSDVIAVVERDGSLRLWNVPQHKVINTLLPAGEPIIGIVWSPDGLLLAYVTSSFEILDIKSKTIVMSFPIEDGSQVWDFSWSVDGKVFLALTDHRIRAWDMETGQLLQEIVLQTREPAATIGKIGDDAYIIAYGGRYEEGFSHGGLNTVTFRRPTP